MSSASVVLLEQARTNRAAADRARRLAKDASLPGDVLEALTRNADELERRALDLEGRAAALSKAAGKTRELSVQIQQVVEETTVRLERMRRGSARPRVNNCLDPSISRRVTEAIDAFIKALEMAAVNPSPKAFDDLDEAADRLMRATGRVRIELGRKPFS